jgi:hypothetical protein
MDNAAKMPHGVVLVCTNAGFSDEWQYDWREAARLSERWYHSAVTEPAPWLDPAEIADAKRRNPAPRFARLWCGQWVRGTGDALSEEDVQAAVTQVGPMDGTESGIVFYSGLDLGVSRDHSAVVVLGYDGHRVRLAKVESWAPPSGGKIDLRRVKRAVADLDKRFSFRRLFFDPYQAELLVQELNFGSRCEAVPFTAASLTEMASVVLEGFHARELDLSPDAGLLSDLHGLRLIDKGLTYRLDSVRSSSGHGDKATAFCLALLAVRRYPSRPPCYPGDRDLESLLESYNTREHESHAAERGLYARGSRYDSNAIRRQLYGSGNPYRTKWNDSVPRG